MRRVAFERLETTDDHRAGWAARARGRTGFAIAAALALHFVPVALFLLWSRLDEPVVTTVAPASLVVMPVPMALPAPRRETPPGPEQIQADAPAPSPQKPRPAPPASSDVPPLPKPSPAAEPQSEQAPAPDTTAPSTAPLPPDDAPAAPLDGGASPTADAVPEWQGAVLGHLDRHKRYPAYAARQRREGVPYVRFALSREGAVVFARLERSSGVSALDTEAVALVHRAQPFPKPPPEVPGDPVELVVPVEYFLRR